MHTERRGLEIPREVRHCALCLVASNDDTDSDLVELLVKVGKADMSALIWNGRRQTARRTALHWAVDGENEAAVRKLIELGANINAVDEDQLSVLHLAVSAEDYYDSVVPIAKLLLESGAMIEAKCPSGRTPLHTAADYLNERIIELLLDHGADIMARDNQGMTALHYAIKSGHLPSVVLLLERGGDLDATDNAGLSARESALQDEDDICPALQDENCICEFIKSLGGGQDDTKHQPSALLTPSPY
jgi:ankyrin repeat protein